MKVCYPTTALGTGVLVLTGSSGRVDTGRAELLARHGAVAAPLQWFGGRGQQPGPWEVPIETFQEALDTLAPEVDHLAIIGVSFGAEAALVTAALDPRVRAVAAFAPTSVVWAGFDEQERRSTSHWTLNGEPLPYVPIVRAATRSSSGLPPSFRATYELSLASAPAEVVNQATIAVERIGEVLLVSGGDDRVWPATSFARAITRRRQDHGLTTRNVTHPEAGHRTPLPGEAPAPGGMTMFRGGSPETDAELGLRAWPELLDLLHLAKEARNTD